MDKRIYHQMKFLSALCFMMWRERKHLDACDDFLKREMRGQRERLQTMRKGNREIPASGRREQEKVAIQRAIGDMYKSSRKSVSGTVGKNIGGALSFSSYRSEHFTMTVGWGWRRKVYLPFYEKLRLEANEWFVLKADEVRVNHPYIRLFEAKAFHFKERTTKTVWIGQSAIGDMKAVIKETSSAAIQSAKLLYEKQINKDIVKKENVS